MAGIVLVHGAWHGAWCWDAFAERLRARGHEVDAVDLRGHGPPVRARLWHRIGDYVQDVAAATSRFPEPPVVVGHSMGGLVVQKYLERGVAGSAVLLGSVPTGGALGATARFAGRHPLVFLHANLTLRLSPIVGSPKLAREMLFTTRTADDVVAACYDRLQEESYPAYLGMILSLPRPHRVGVPVLVVAGSSDRIFSVKEAMRTARAYGTAARIMPGRGHDLMLEAGWEVVADLVDEWSRTDHGAITRQG